MLPTGEARESKRDEPHPRGGRVWFSQGVLSPLLQSRGASTEGERANWGATAPPRSRGLRNAGRETVGAGREEAWTEGVGVWVLRGAIPGKS